MPKPYELFAALPPAVSDQLFAFLFEREKPLYKATIETLAKQRKLRPVFVERKPRVRGPRVDERYARAQAEHAVAAHLLQIWRVGTQAWLLCVSSTASASLTGGMGPSRDVPPEPEPKKPSSRPVGPLFEKHDQR